MATKSPVEVKRRGNKMLVESTFDGSILAECFIGDDFNTEKIADILSAKGLPRAAEQFRQIVMDSRKRAKA